MNMDFSFGGPEGGGPDISGKWTNKRTGRTIIVRDCFVEGNNMVIRLSDGSIIDMDVFSRDYYQMDESQGDNNQPIPQQSSVNEQTLFAGMERSSIDKSTIDAKKDEPIEADDLESLYNPYESFSKETQSGIIGVAGTKVDCPTYMTTKELPNPKRDLLNKLFSQMETGPNISIDIIWEEFPKKELDMLRKFFDVTDDDISNYMVDNYLSKDDIVKSIIEFFKKENNCDELEEE